MLRKVTFIIVALSISACAYAEFSDGKIHVIYDFYIDNVFVDYTHDRRPGTHVFFVPWADGFSNIEVYHHGQFTYCGAYTGMSINAYDDAAVTIQSGSLSSLYCSDNSHTVVWGGEFSNIYTDSTTTQVVIRGQDFTLDGQPIDYGEVVLKYYNPGGFYYGRLKGNLPGNPQFNVSCLSYSGPNSRIFALPGNCPRADLNGDCKVDFFDLAILTSEWLDSGL